MARNKQWKGAAEKRDGGAFRQIPLSVLEGRAYLDCSAYAVKLLFDLLTQYRGQNNGDLTAAWKVMKPRGWRSEATLHKAKQELLAAGLIVETRMGARPNKCSLYALTFFTLDENDKLEMTKRSFPQGKYKLKDPTQFVAKAPDHIQLKRVIESATLTTAGVVGSS
jgi:hypothetical protein